MYTNCAPHQQRQRYGYLICLVLFASYLLVYFHRVCPSVIALDMQRAFGVGGVLLGALGSAYFYPYALMQLPVGLLVDSWGARRTISVFMLIAAAGSVVMGLAGHIGTAIVGRVLVGIGISTIFVANFKLLTEWFEPRRMTFLGGIFMAVGGVGALAASWPLAVSSSLIGWNWTLVGVGGLTLAMSGLAFAVVRDRPTDRGWPDLRERSPGEAKGTFGGWRGVGHVVATRRFWLMAVWGGINPGLAFAVGGLWGGPYLQQVYGMSQTQAGVYQTAFGLALILGGPLLALLANRVGRKPVLVGTSVLMALTFGLFRLFPTDLPAVVLYGQFFCIFLTGAAIGPIAATVSKELFDPAIAGTSVGLINCFPFFFGGIFQVLMGMLLDQHAYAPAGYESIFTYCCAGALIALIAACNIPETLPPRPGQRP